MISDIATLKRQAYGTGFADPGQVFSLHIAVKERAEEAADFRALGYAAFLTKVLCANLPDVPLYMHAQEIDTCLSRDLASADLQAAKVIRAFGHETPYR